MCCCFSPDGAHILSASEDGTLKLWCAAGGTLEQTLTGHAETVYCCCFSPDGARILSASHDGTLNYNDMFSSLRDNSNDADAE